MEFQKEIKGKKSEQGKETVPNANYLWINLFATALKEKVMITQVEGLGWLWQTPHLMLGTQRPISARL